MGLLPSGQFCNHSHAVVWGLAAVRLHVLPQTCQKDWTRLLFRIPLAALTGRLFFPWISQPQKTCLPNRRRVQSLSKEAPLEKGMVTHSSILAWRIQWTEEPGRVQSMGRTLKCFLKIAYRREITLWTLDEVFFKAEAGSVIVNY